MLKREEASRGGFGQCSGQPSSGGRFKVVDHGAQITEWTPGGPPVLWISQEAVFSPKAAIRGGMPICFPWFGSGRGGRKTPSHGFARLSEWRLRHAQEFNGESHLEWELTPADLPVIDRVDPYRNEFVLTCRQSFGQSLNVVLQVRNTDNKPLVFEEALHTYFTVGDIRDVALHGLGGSEYVDQILGTDHTQVGPVTFNGEVDRIYHSRDTVEIHDPSLQRRIVIEKSGSADTIVWNPWIEKARKTPDMGDNEWVEMVCVETANIRQNALHLNPGHTHETKLKISVLDL